MILGLICLLSSDLPIYNKIKNKHNYQKTPINSKNGRKKQ
tara:strand:- start:1367 stop:1486 length:120 start_codon:yes stop_codon:yes gene_type:complete